MQQRRVKLGDILDDYCPRERRITNHAVVAMIDDEVKQTRCTTCEADHEYKRARVPPQRRRKGQGGALDVSEAASLRPRPLEDGASEPEEAADVESSPVNEVSEGPIELAAAADEEPEPAADREDEGPVHRRLIRATLPRPEGQAPERKIPEFTIRQPGARSRDFDRQKNDNRHHGRQSARPSAGSQGSRFGPARHGSGQGPRHGFGGPGSESGHGHRPGGNRAGHGHPGAPRGNRPGPRRGGRKRGR